MFIKICGILVVLVIGLTAVLGYIVLRVDGEESDYWNKLGRIIGMDAVSENNGIIDTGRIPKEMHGPSLRHGYVLMVNTGYKISLDSKSEIPWGFYVPTKVDAVYGAIVSNQVIGLGVYDDLHVERMDVSAIMRHLQKWRDIKAAQQVDSAAPSTKAVP